MTTGVRRRGGGWDGGKRPTTPKPFFDFDGGPPPETPQHSQKRFKRVTERNRERNLREGGCGGRRFTWIVRPTRSFRHYAGGVPTSSLSSAIGEKQAFLGFFRPDHLGRQLSPVSVHGVRPIGRMSDRNTLSGRVSVSCERSVVGRTLVSRILRGAVPCQLF